MADQLHLDFETRSEIDLAVRGLDNYLRHPTAQSLMLAWAFNEQKVQLWEPHTGQPMPAEVEEGLRDPWVVKFAWNAGFERTVLKYLHNIWVPYNEWVDPMVNARHLSLPGYLEDAGKILKLAQDEVKMEEGARLVKKFTEPAVAASSGGLFGSVPAAFRDWATDPEDWALFGDYCKNDVVAERAIAKKLSKYPLPPAEQKLWELDQAINDRGMPIDMAVLRGARHVVDIEMTKLRTRLKELTGLENPNSNDQMLGWIQEQGYTFGALGKPLVARAFAGECNLTPLGREVLEIRSLTAKAAVHKFTALADNVSEDGRIRGQFVFSGAGRSSRWCLAEGSLIRIRTVEGVVQDAPIENVSVKDEVWDGENWVNHGGVVYSGEKDVITWDGVTASPEHMVWTSPAHKCTFASARSNRQKLWEGK